MRKILIREADEKRPLEQGGKTWQSIANDLEAEIEALKEERHAADTAQIVLAKDVVRKAEEVLRLGQQLQKLQLEYRELQDRIASGVDGVDVQAEVEPEDVAVAGG